MQGLFDFMSRSPFLTFFLMGLLCSLIKQVFRSVTIWMHGYPPMWCDVNGKFPDKEKTR